MTARPPLSIVIPAYNEATRLPRTLAAVRDRFPGSAPQVVVVDDILITCGSVLEGISKLESSGLVVKDVVVFIDHGGRKDRKARERLEQQGYRVHAVLDIERITEVLVQAGRLSPEQAAVLA